jgi:primosomal protein N' (replication factor Y)
MYTINTNNKLKEMIEKILNNEIDIIIGTQLIAKGHHFPNLTLVGVVDSDASLFSGDIRAGEKTFQLLTQVSGRAGRETIKGKVYLQSYSPENIILQSLKNKDKNLFIDFEKKNRKLGNFTPFGKMATISVVGNNEEKIYRVAKDIVLKCPFDEKIEILGPSPVIATKKYKCNIIIKTDKNVNIQELIRMLIKDVKETIYIDID